MASAASTILRQYRSRWIRATGGLLAVRVSFATLAAIVLCLSASGWIVGPMTGFAAATVAWSAIFGGVALLFYWSFRPYWNQPAPRDFAVLRAESPLVGSKLQSALELEHAEYGSKALIEAHTQQTLRTVESNPLRSALPWRWVADRRFLALLLAAGMIAIVSSRVPRAAGGKYALLRFASAASVERSLGFVVQSSEATLRYPEYMKRSAAVFAPADEVRGPRGTTVEYRLRTITRARSVTLELPGQRVKARADGDEHVATFVLEADGEIGILVESWGGEERYDHRVRTLVVTPDEVPAVTLLQPIEDFVTEAGDSVDIRARVLDDYGITDVALMVEGPGGDKWGRPLQFDETESSETSDTLRLAELDIRPGDAIQLWVEARDTNQLDGPGVGRSEVRTITLASDSTRRRQQIVGLEAALETGLTALGDRLENPVPASLESKSNERFSKVSASTNLFVEDLSAWHEQSDAPASERTMLGNAAHALRGLSQKERALPRNKKLSNYRKRSAVDADIIEELEDAVLAISDLISSARLEDAVTTAQQLDRLRKEMRSLLSEIRRTNSPEAEKALRAALARAERRMNELLQQLLESRRFVPGEFVNQEAAQARQSRSSLRELRDAIDRGDLDAAEEALMDMQRTIDQIASQLGNNQEAFAEARFGPRERALSEAVDALRNLEVRQDHLAERATELSRKAAQRAGEDAEGGLDENARQRLSEQHQSVGETLRGMSEGALGPTDRRTRDVALERLNDLDLALQRGQLGEAFAMADEATRALEDLSRDLRLSALMFPGREGRTSNAAAGAARAAQEANEMREALQSALPDSRDDLTPSERKELRRQAKRQRRAQKSLEKVAEEFETGPDDVPLSEDAARKLRELSQPMEEAADHLDNSDPVRARPRQRTVADQLQRLRESLEQGQSRQSRSQQGGRGQDATGGRQAIERVDVPGKRSNEEYRRWRRRVQSARRGRAPEGYENAVKEYYERLLR